VSAPTVTRTERGYAGHFIGCAKCSFRRNTLLELGEVRVVVSTVGSYCAGENGEPCEIGADRYYETMLFRARLEKPYWEQEGGSNIPFYSPWSLNHCEWESDFAADLMHETVVAEIAARMEAGETF